MNELLNKRWFLLFLFLVALLMRFCFVPNPGFEADIAFWKSWGLAPYDHGLIDGLALTNNNYPTHYWRVPRATFLATWRRAGGDAIAAVGQPTIPVLW